MMSVFRSFVVLATLLICLPALCFADTTAPTATPGAHPVVVIHVEHAGQPLGDITIELYPEDAPLSVANFLKLVNSKFYDGLTFHRIAELAGSSGKIVQGGDPQGNGTGGPGWTIKGEFTDNGVNNPLVHDAGAVAMARSSSYDSAGSQFYICVDPVHFLDGHYAVFGKVTSGLGVADKIQMGDKMTSVTVGPSVSVQPAPATPVVTPPTPVVLPPTPAPTPVHPPMKSSGTHTGSGHMSLSSKNAALLSAAAAGDLATLKHLLASGANVNAKDADGGTALMSAALNGHLDCVKALISAGANVMATDSLGESAADYGAAFPDVADAIRAAASHKASSM